MEFVVDGNAYLNIAMSVVKGVIRNDRSYNGTYHYNNLFNDTPTLKSAIAEHFRKFCFTYLSSIITPLGSSLGGVHFVMDSKSWRKAYISNYFSDSEFKTDSAPSAFKYKEGRSKDEYEYLFFDYFKDEILPGLIDCGMSFYQSPGTEGDDLIAHLVETLDDDIMIYSVDKDIKQLVNSVDKNILLIMPKQSSKHKKIFVPKYYLPGPTEPKNDDFFGLSESDMNGGDSTIESIIKSYEAKDYVQYQVDPVFEVLDKVLSGDKSDKIPRLDKLTPAKAKKVLESTLAKFDNILDKIDSFDSDLMDHIIEKTCEVTKVESQDKQDDLRSHLRFNIITTRLSSKVFPKEISESISTAFDKTKEHNFDIRQYNAYKNTPTKA